MCLRVVARGCVGYCGIEGDTVGLGAMLWAVLRQCGSGGMTRAAYVVGRRAMRLGIVYRPRLARDAVQL